MKCAGDMLKMCKLYYILPTQNCISCWMNPRDTEKLLLWGYDRIAVDKMSKVAFPVNNKDSTQDR